MIALVYSKRVILQPNWWPLAKFRTKTTLSHVFLWKWVRCFQIILICVNAVKTWNSNNIDVKPITSSLHTSRYNMVSCASLLEIPTLLIFQPIAAQLCFWHCRAALWLVRIIAEGHNFSWTSFPAAGKTEICLCAKKKFWDLLILTIYTNSLVNATFGSWKKSC